MVRKLLQINPVLRNSTSTGRIMQEIGDLAMSRGWESYVAYSRGRDGIRDCTSEVIPVGDAFSVAWHGLMTRAFDRHGLASCHATRRFISDIEALDPDVIHIHNIHGYFLNYRLLLDWLAKSGKPVVWTVHDCWMFTGHCYYYTAANCGRWKTGCGNCPQKGQFPRSIIVDRSARNWHDKAKAFSALNKNQLTIVPVSEWLREEMSESFLKEFNFRVIHNGIDTSVFSPEDPETARDRYRLDGKHIILGVASVWSREKGLGDFIRLSGSLRDDERIVLVGVSPSQVKNLPGNMIPIFRTENACQLAELYSAADVFVNPTWQDNYPTVNLEAISCGTPVITYRTGGSVESITDGTGWIVEPGDMAGLRMALDEAESLDRSACRERCRQYALAHFRKEDRYADYLALYDEIVSEKTECL